jgi:hypothetical protein
MKSKGHKIARTEAAAGAVIRIYGSAEPEPKELCMAPQNCEKFANKRTI